MDLKKKTKEVFKRTSTKESYQNGLMVLRNKYGVPFEGFDSEVQKKEWESTLGEKLISLTDELVALNREHNISPTYYDFQEELFYYGLDLKESINDNQLCHAYINDDKGVKRLHIIVNPQATLTDLKTFLDKNNEVKKLMREVKYGSDKRVVVPKNRKRDEYVCRLSQTIERDGLRTKNEVIAKKTNKVFGLPNIYAETVKTILARSKKKK